MDMVSSGLGKKIWEWLYGNGREWESNLTKPSLGRLYCAAVMRPTDQESSCAVNCEVFRASYCVFKVSVASVSYTHLTLPTKRIV